MGIFGKFKDFVGIEQLDEDEITEDEIKAAAAQLDMSKSDMKPSSYAAARSEKDARDAKDSKLQQNKARPVNPNTSPFKLVVIEPRGFDECPNLVDNLKGRKPVIINLEKMESDTARKIFDFLSGATYALNGNVQKVANNIFVFAPENVDISANVEHKGMDFTTGMQKHLWR
jgi:cell division inhibitor SepF